MSVGGMVSFGPPVGEVTLAQAIISSEPIKSASKNAPSLQRH